VFLSPTSAILGFEYPTSENAYWHVSSISENSLPKTGKSISLYHRISSIIQGQLVAVGEHSVSRVRNLIIDIDSELIT
jgi:hypothetical protein